MSVKKSYQESDPIKDYCLRHSSPLHPVQLKLLEETLKHPRAMMMGAPEIVSMNAMMIRSLAAKKVIDVGVFTGASSLAAALALPEDGLVIGCDVNEEFTRLAQEYWVEAGVQHKVKLVLAPATETLGNLLKQGEGGTFDFAFIDADKTGYDSYYELCLSLLRKGGVVAFDNTLWSGKVVREENQDVDTVALRQLNKKIVEDYRVHAVMMNIGDGYTLVSKL